MWFQSARDRILPPAVMPNILVITSTRCLHLQGCVSEKGGHGVISCWSKTRYIPMGLFVISLRSDGVFWLCLQGLPSLC